VVALIVGVVMILAGLARLGVIADFLSEPVLKGFIVGVAITIVVGQLPKLVGVESDADGFLQEIWELVGSLPQTNPETLMVGVGSLAALFLLERFLKRIPAALIVVIGSILVVNLFDLTSAGVAVAGEIPSGLPSFAVPSVGWDVLLGLIPGAIGVAIVVYGESMALAKTFSSKHGERVDADQELIALGAGNVVGGLFGGFTTEASNSRSAAADGAGQATQLASVITGVLLIVTLLFLTSLFADLPDAALGAIVIHAVLGLIRFGPIRVLYSRNRVDFWAATATLGGVLFFDVLAGLMIGVVVSLFGLMRRVVRPRITWLGLDPANRLFNPRQEPGVEEIRGIAIVHIASELFFANVGVFRDAVLAEVDDKSPSYVVVDAEAISDIDTTAVEEIQKLEGELSERGVSLVFARLDPEAREALIEAGVSLEGDEYGRVIDAVEALRSGRGPE
jgi:high affinity sulfate transporter 1